MNEALVEALKSEVMGILFKKFGTATPHNDSEFIDFRKPGGVRESWYFKHRGDSLVIRIVNSGSIFLHEPNTYWWEPEMADPEFLEKLETQIRLSKIDRAVLYVGGRSPLENRIGTIS